MNKIKSTSIFTFLILSVSLTLNSCSDSGSQKSAYPSDVIPFFDHFNLILGDGSNAGQAINFEHEDFFYTANDGTQDWVVFKTPI